MGGKVINSTFPRQSGAALIYVLVVLTVITILATSAISDNQLQSTLVRNNQMRLDAFNSSYSEINARVDAVSDRVALSQLPWYVRQLGAGDIGDSVGTDTGQMNVITPTAGENKLMRVTLHGNSCFDSGNNIKSACYSLRYTSTSTLGDTNIQSIQNQLIEIPVASAED
jgi:Tfp pilus assembly protein PilX